MFNWKRIKCYFLGHTHPWFTCFRCGKKSSMEFIRDDSGDVVRDDNGAPLYRRHGRRK
jgi:hypothetical protein